MEFTQFLNINFAPARPDPGRVGKLCIATKSRNLGDALALTTLPRLLKQRYPHLRISTYPRGFNPVVFKFNPYVEGVTHFPSAVYGDDANWESGQLIQLKEQFFGLDPSPSPKPEIHLAPPEREWAERFLKSKQIPSLQGKKLCVIHPWGTSRNNVARIEFWDELVARWKGKFRFWQVGLIGQGAVQGCEYYFLTKPKVAQARKLFALMEKADLFLGVDSGPMHVARAFNIPSLIFLNHAEPSRVFENRALGAYFLHSNWLHSVLYAENEHCKMNAQAAGIGDRFLEKNYAP